MLLTVAIFGLGGVLVLGAMAKRYAKVHEEKVATQESKPTHTPGRGFRTGAATPGKGDEGSVKAPGSKAAASANDSAPEDRAARYVDEFLAIRASMKLALADVSGRSRAVQADALQQHRDRQIADSWMRSDEYRQMVRLYRQWQEGSPPATPAFAAEMERRRASLLEAGLGEFEEFDR